MRKKYKQHSNQDRIRIVEYANICKYCMGIGHKTAPHWMRLGREEALKMKSETQT